MSGFKTRLKAIFNNAITYGKTNGVLHGALGYDGGQRCALGLLESGVLALIADESLGLNGFTLPQLLEPAVVLAGQAALSLVPADFNTNAIRNMREIPDKVAAAEHMVISFNDNIAQELTAPYEWREVPEHEWEGVTVPAQSVQVPVPGKTYADTVLQVFERAIAAVDAMPDEVPVENPNWQQGDDSTPVSQQVIHMLRFGQANPTDVMAEARQPSHYDGYDD
jgi:hypothetical protein